MKVGETTYSDYDSNLKKKKIYTKIEVGLHSITYLLITNSCGYCQSSGKKNNDDIIVLRC